MTNSHLKEFLTRLRLDPLFKDLMKELKGHRPVVPTYKPCETEQELFSLMEKIRFESGRQEGFDAIFLRLTGEKVND